MLLAIDRPEVAQSMQRHNIVPLLADWTDTSASSTMSNQIRQKLHELGCNSIPALAIYPADPQQAPIVLRDVITQQQLLDAIDQAGRITTAGQRSPYQHR
jgi:thiol:disulfide interchange protein